MRGSVCGSVVRAGTGAPIVDAVIGIVEGPGSAPEPLIVTDEDGGFIFPGLSEGLWVLSATCRAGTGQAVVHVFNNATSDVTIEVAAGASAPRPGTCGGTNRTEPGGMTGSVRGRVVRAADWRPVADAAITVVRGAGPAPDISPITNEMGQFALDDLPAGEWVLHALSPNGEMGNITFYVPVEGETDITIVVKPAES